MLGQNYFEGRLNELYQYCLVNYLSGSGELTAKDSDETTIKVNWELCQGITGEILFILSSSSDIKTGNKKEFIHFNFNGISSDSIWNITTENLIIHSQKFDWDANNDSFTYFCSVQKLLLKNRQNYQENKFTKAVAHLYNFNFIGLDFSEYENLNKCDKFNCNANNKEIQFKLLYDDQAIRELIASDRIPKAVLSTMEYPINQGENLESCIHEITKICYFLGIATLNTNFAPNIEFFSGSKKVAIILQEVFSLPYHENVLLDNFEIRSGIPSFFDKCYSNYMELSNSFKIDQFITLMQELQNQRHIELKIAVLLLAYENLLSQYLVHKGISLDELKESNVEQKLRTFNSMFRFIKKDFLGEDLRDSARNKLFHLGDIPFLHFEEKIEIFEKYYELIIQILFKILDYHGDYINRLDYTKSSI